jgi:transcriptional regulator with XRE-family HTH domain
MEKSIHSTRYAVFLSVLREARERAGLTQVQLARKIGETQTFVSKCERGERRVDVVELRTFCRAFGSDLKLFVAALEKALDERAGKGRQK